MNTHAHPKPRLPLAALLAGLLALGLSACSDDEPAAPAAPAAGTQPAAPPAAPAATAEQPAAPIELPADEGELTKRADAAVDAQQLFAPPGGIWTPASANSRPRNCTWRSAPWPGSPASSAATTCWAASFPASASANEPGSENQPADFNEICMDGRGTSWYDATGLVPLAGWRACREGRAAPAHPSPPLGIP